jgi:hypothetical protein
MLTINARDPRIVERIVTERLIDEVHLSVISTSGITCPDGKRGSERTNQYCEE